MTSIVQDWAAELGLRHQGVLMAAIRGCDSAEREDDFKWLSRFYRACVLKAHCKDPRNAVSFMLWCDDEDLFKQRASFVVKSFDHYPVHFLLHFIHAAEICGYKMPGPQGAWWKWFYLRMVTKFHMNPETEVELDARLNAPEMIFKEQQL